MRGAAERGATAALQARIQEAWPAAIARWSSFMVLAPPQLDPQAPHIAQIDLGSRRVLLNGRLITDLGVEDCIPAMLAHELGHHVCYPGTLQVQARLALLERTLLPDPSCSFTNHFTDLMINQRLGDSPELRAQMIRIYQAGARPWDGGLGAFMGFYFALYEALWELPPGEILGAAGVRALTRDFPLHRAEAQVLAQDLFLLGPNLYTQFLYFLSVAIRYHVQDLRQQMPGTRVRVHGVGGCSCAEPSAVDWGQALTPTRAEKEAIERARQRGWFDATQGGRLGRALAVDERIAGLPGVESQDAARVPPIMAVHYRQQAERLLFRPPAQPRIGEAVLPGLLEDWAPGDPVREIDWRSTWQLRGRALGAALPVRRVLEAELPGEDVRFLQTRMEIYLDISGSMPNPCLRINPLTLAAQILTTATLREGGQVRLALYSHETLTHWDWCRSERELSGFLMHYIGGGTQFPFRLLEESTRSESGRQPIRVIISDHDFDANVAAEPRALQALAQAARDTPGLILLAGGGEGEMHAAYRRLGIRVVAVGALDSYPRVARELAWALFPHRSAP